MGNNKTFNLDDHLKKLDIPRSMLMKTTVDPMKWFRASGRFSLHLEFWDVDIYRPLAHDFVVKRP